MVYETSGYMNSTTGSVQIRLLLAALSVTPVVFPVDSRLRGLLSSVCCILVFYLVEIDLIVVSFLFFASFCYFEACIKFPRPSYSKHC